MKDRGKETMAIWTTELYFIVGFCLFDFLNYILTLFFILMPGKFYFSVYYTSMVSGKHQPLMMCGI